MSEQATGEDLRGGQDALGTRYMRCDLGDVEVMVLVFDNDALLSPGLTKRVEMAAGLALDQLRVSTVGRRE